MGEERARCCREGAGGEEVDGREMELDPTGH